VTATFNQAVMGTSTSTFTLQTSAGRAVRAVVTYNSATHVATLSPSARLQARTSYRVTLTGGITSPNQVALKATSWSFTTGRN
ncbi:MAG: Ig-like domain-containing protein, partial [Terracoccus sp.]